MDRRSWKVKVDILAAKYLQTFEEDSILEPIPPEYCSGRNSSFTFKLKKSFLKSALKFCSISFSVLFCSPNIACSLFSEQNNMSERKCQVI
jgi:hypothetical protein